MEPQASTCQCTENNKRTISYVCKQTNINSSSCGSCHLQLSHINKNCTNKTRTTNTSHCKMKVQFYYINRLISSAYSVLLFLLCSSVVYSNSTLNVIIEDQIAQVGHYFHCNILTNDSFLNHKIKVSEAGIDKLPNWLLFDKSVATLYGIPSQADEGNIFIVIKVFDNKDQFVFDEVFSIDVRPAGSSLFSRKLSKSFLQRTQVSRTITQSGTTQQSQGSSTLLSKQTLYFLPIHCTSKSNIVTANVLLRLNYPLAPKQSVDLFILLSDLLGVGIDKLYLSDKEYSRFDSKVVLWGRHGGSDSRTTVASNQTFTLISFIIGCNKDVVYSDIYRVVIERLDKLLESVNKIELLQNILERWFITVEGDDVSEAKRLHERQRRQAAVLLTEVPEPNFDIVFTTAVTDLLTTSIPVPTSIIPSVDTTQPAPSSIVMTSDLLTIQTIFTATPSFVVSSDVMVADSSSTIPTPSITVLEPSTTIPPLITPSVFITPLFSEPTSVAPVLTSTPSFSINLTSTPVIIMDSSPVITLSAVLTTTIAGDETSIPSLSLTTPLLTSVFTTADSTPPLFVTASVFTTVDDETSIPSLFVTTLPLTSAFTTDVIFTPSFVVTPSESLMSFISPSETSQPTVITATTVVVDTPMVTETSLLFSPPFTSAVIDTSSFPPFTASSITEIISSSPLIIIPSSTFLETSVEIPTLTTVISPDTSIEIPTTSIVPDTSIEIPNLTTAITPDTSAEIPTLTTFIAPETSIEIPTLTTAIAPDTSIEIPTLTTFIAPETSIEAPPLTTVLAPETSSIIQPITSVFTGTVLTTAVTIVPSSPVFSSVFTRLLPESSLVVATPQPSVTLDASTIAATSVVTELPITSVMLTSIVPVFTTDILSISSSDIVFPSVTDVIIPTTTILETFIMSSFVSPTPNVTDVLMTSIATILSSQVTSVEEVTDFTIVPSSSAPALITTVGTPSVIDTSELVEISSTPVEITTILFSPTPFVSSAVVDTSQPIETSSAPADVTTVVFSPSPSVSFDTSQLIDTSSTPVEVTTALFTTMSSLIIDTSSETSSMPIQITTIIFSPTPFVSSAVVDTSEPSGPTTTLPIITVPSISTDTFIPTSFVVTTSSSPTPVQTIVSSVVPPGTTSQVVSLVTMTPSMSLVETTAFVPMTTPPASTLPSVTSVALPDTTSLVFSSVITPTGSEVFDPSTLIPSSAPPTVTGVIASTVVSPIPTTVTIMLPDSSEVVTPTTTVRIFTPSLVSSDIINTTTITGDTDATEIISPTPTLTTAVVILTSVDVSSSVMDVPTTTGPVFNDFTTAVTSVPVFTMTAASPSITSMDAFTTVDPTTSFTETSQVLPTMTNILPTTTMVPVTTMVTTIMTPSPIPTITNQPPQLINPIDPLLWNEGQPATYDIPENTFYDNENGSTSNLALILLHSTGQAVVNTSWVQLIDGVLYGLPLQEQIDNLAITEHIFILVAQDPQNAIARDFIVISVLPQDPFVANFITFFVDGDFGIFDQQIISKIDLANRLASFGPNSGVYVRNLFNGSIGIQYGNTTIPNSDCETFNDLVGSIYNNVMSAYSNSFTTALMPYNVTKVPIIDGPCLLPVGPNVSDVSTIEERSSNNFYYIILPGVLIAVILLVGAILACVLYRRTHSERKKLYRENLDVTFINRRAIILEEEDRKRPKRSHRPTLLYGELPQDEVPDHDETDAGKKLTEPPKHVKEPLIPDYDPPAYQLAPIFDNYAIHNEDSHDRSHSFNTHT